MFLDEIPQKIDAKILSEVIPHSGPMVLLDWVDEWDDFHIVCTTHSHHRPNNPLRINQALSAVHTIEYAAQAASFHAALMSIKYRMALDGIDKFGRISTAFLAVVREFHFTDTDLAMFEDRLTLHAYNPVNGPRMLQYQMRAELNNTTIAYGQISLVVEG